MLSDRTIRALGLSFHRCVRDCEGAARFSNTRRVGRSPAWIGKAAERLWIERELPRLPVHRFQVEPLTAVSGTGAPRRADVLATIAGCRVLIELKKSDYGGYRAEHQLQSQLFHLGFGVDGATALLRICADDQFVDVWEERELRPFVNTALREGRPWDYPTGRRVHFSVKGDD